MCNFPLSIQNNEKFVTQNTKILVLAMANCHYRDVRTLRMFCTMILS